MKSILNRSIVQHAKAFRNKEYTSYELTRAFLEKIEAEDNIIQSYISLNSEEALERASLADEMINKGSSSLLMGIPFSVKDSIITKNLRTTAGSKILGEYIPPYNASVITKLNECGAIILGKTNMDEFAMGSSCENSAFKMTYNPLDCSRISGGSSGGSCASVSGNFAVFSLGSDTGGSIRQPAAYNGLYGLKPTYGAVSRSGLISFAPSLDQIGPICKNIEDTRLIFETIRGIDKNDFTSKKYIEYTGKINRITLIEGIDYSCFDSLIKRLQRQYEITIKRIDNLDLVLPAYKVISSAEAFSNLARYDGIRYGYRTQNSYSDIDDFVRKNRTEGLGLEAKKRIINGAFCLSCDNYQNYFLKAVNFRRQLKCQMMNLLKETDLILLPTVPDVAPRLDDPQRFDDFKICDMLNSIANLCGLPSLSVPIWKDKMPIGIQLISKDFSENMLFDLANMIEEDV